MSNDKQAAYLVTGCLFLLWQLFLVLPLSAAVLFGILDTIGAPTWVWVLYWIYLPSSLFGLLVAGVVRTLSDSN